MPPASHPVQIPHPCSPAGHPDIQARIVRYAPGFRQASHTHDHASITLIVQGGVEEESPHASSRLAVGDCLIKPPGIRHADRFGETETTTLQLQFPVGPPRGMSAIDFRLQDYRCGGNDKLAPVLFSIFACIREGNESASPPALNDLIIDALALAAAESCRASAARPLWMARAEREIMNALPDVPRVADLAAAIGVHPVHMARAFQRVHGCGVVDFIRRLRVQHAAAALARRRSTLCDAALAAGFCDQPHLNRAFRRQLGMSPGRYRRLTRAGEHPAGILFS